MLNDISSVVLFVMEKNLSNLKLESSFVKENPSSLILA